MFLSIRLRHFSAIEFLSPTVYNYKASLRRDIIKLITLFKHAMTRPDKLMEARKLKTSRIVLYFLFISFILSIPSWVQTTTLLNEFVQDGQEIAEHIPEFKVENDQLVPGENAESFIYQTDSVIFAFDPSGEVTPSEMERRVVGDTIGVSLLEKGLYLNIPFYPIQLSYSQLNGLNANMFKEVILSVQQINPVVLLITFLILWVSSLILAVIYNFIYTVFGNLVAAITRKQMRFGETWKIVLFASTLPTLFFSVLNSFAIHPVFQFEIQVGITLYFYYLALKSLSKEEESL